MTKFCEHTYDGKTTLTKDCDHCTFVRGQVVGYIKAENERNAVRGALGKKPTRYMGAVKIGDGWATYSMKGEKLE